MAENSSLQELDDLLRRVRSSRRRFEPEWYLNVSYYHGKQWVRWNRGRINEPQLEPWRVKVVDNRILPVTQSRVARKIKTRPTFVATPFSYDEEDLSTAELSEKILENDWITLNIQDKLYHALLWADIAAAGFLKVYWDSNKGDGTEYLIGPDGNVLVDGQGSPIPAHDLPDLAGMEGVQKKRIAEGNIQIDVLSPFELYPDPLASELHECEFLIEEKVRSKEYVQERYNQTVEPDTPAPTGITESRLVGGTPDSSESYKGVTVYELWGREGSKWGDKGKRACWSKNQMLYEGDLSDSPFDGCPYVMFNGVKVPGRFWPTSITSQLRGPQTELNKIKSQIRENAVRLGNPALLTSRQANIEYDGYPGERVEFDSTVPDAVPDYLRPPEMPVYVQTEIERIENAFTEISGIHEVSKATVPSGVTAASAINLLQEADDTRLGPEIQDMEKALSELGTKILRLRAKFQEDQKIIQIAGEDGAWDIRQYKSTMLKPNVNAEVQAGSAMPRSKAAKQAAMSEVLALVFQYGIEVSPRDLRKFLRDFGIGGLEHMFATLTNDEQQIQREHMSFYNNQALDIRDWDDDDVHIEAHNEERKLARFERADEQVKAIFDAHIRAHQERRTKMIEAQLTRMPVQPNGNQNGGQIANQEVQ